MSLYDLAVADGRQHERGAVLLMILGNPVVAPGSVTRGPKRATTGRSSPYTPGRAAETASVTATTSRA